MSSLRIYRFSLPLVFVRVHGGALWGGLVSLDSFTVPGGKRQARFRRFRACLASLLFLVVLASMLIAASASRAFASVSFVQGSTFATAKLTSTTVTLSKPVGAGDLLVGWFAQYGASGAVQVSDSVNGAWTRAPSSEQFGGSTGDIAMYYLVASKASAGGLTITVSAATAAYLQGAVTEYSGVATSSPLLTMAVNRGSTTAVSTGSTASVAAGQLVYAAEVTGSSPGGVPTPGSSDGMAYTVRSSTSSGSAFEEDITASAAGAQTGTATLKASADWYAVVAAFQVAGSSPSPSPSSSSPSPSPSSSSPSPSPSSSSPSPSPSPTGTGTPPPPGSISFVQGTSFATQKLTSTTVSLAKPVQAGDLLVGWFAQYGASGTVKVSDNVNGTWTRAPSSEQFGSSASDVALYYLAGSKAASGGLTMTVSASTAAYLQGAVAEYSGVATSSPLVTMAVSKGASTAVNTGATASVGAGQLVYAAEVTGTSPGGVPTAGSSDGVAFTVRSSTSSGSAFEEDITASAAGAQQGTATLKSAADWYAVVAAFQVAGSTPSPSPSSSSPSPSPSPSSSSPSPSPSSSSPSPSPSPSSSSPSPSPSSSSPSPSPSGPPPPGPISFVQGNSVATARVASATVTLSKPVGAGDLLVGWFAQYDASGHVQVSDNVNGTWTRAPGSLAYQNDGGDIALYYLADAKASASGIQITISASSATYLDGIVSEYSGVALAGALDQEVAARGVGTNVNTGSTASVPAGELVYSAVITGQAPGGFTPGSSQGVAFTTRISADSGSLDEADITSAAAGSQQGTATLPASTDWYAAAATFQALPANVSTPSAPTGLSASSVSASRVALHWSASTGSVAGYLVLRNGVAIASTTGTSFIDETVAPSASYTYTVEAFNGENQQSAPSSPVQVQTPANSPAFVQGISASPGSRASSLTLTLSKPVGTGDLLAGWFGQFDATGQVQVSDNVNGAWTRSVSEKFSGGGGDIALYYVANSKAAPNGLTITISASSATYLQESIADFSGVATTSPLDQAVVDTGNGTAVTGGTTAAAPAGELAIAGLITGGQPGTITAGSSQQVPYVIDVQNGSGSADMEDILSTAAGTQTASNALGSGSDWYMVVATFRPASG
jgi:hypothetical protein